MAVSPKMRRDAIADRRGPSDRVAPVTHHTLMRGSRKAPVLSVGPMDKGRGRTPRSPLWKEERNGASS